MTSSTETTNPATDSVTSRENPSGREPQNVENGGVQFRQTGDASAAITSIAAQSVSQPDFLRRLATEMIAAFPVQSVAVTHPSWDVPMMLVSESSLADRLDGKRIGELLKSSTTAPSACDLPQRSSTESSENRTRGLHTRLSEQAAASCAILLVYDAGKTPDPAGQFRDLKRLAEYAKPSRSALSSLAAHGDAIKPTGGLATLEQQRALRHFHNDLDLTGTAYRIANETRRILSVDRVTVLLATRGRLRVESVSGVAVVDRRANSITAAESFAERVIVLGRPIVLPTSTPLPPQIAEPLDHYFDETDVAGVAVVPLYRPTDLAATEAGNADGNQLAAAMYTEDQATEAEPIAVLLLEFFSNDHPHDLTPAMREIGAEAAIALSNSMEHRRIFGLRFLKTMGDWFGGRNLPYTTLGLIAAAGLLAASMIIQVDHKVIATGFAEPASQQNVFARTDGIVKEIMVRDGQQVAAGDTLMRLENADLETSAETLSGETLTTSRRLASIGSMLLDPATDPKQAGRMAIEQRQLQSELASLQNQSRLVREQLSQLNVTAPIDGVVAGWQLKRKLSDRPVGRGNHLLTVVRTDGPWQLRLEIPDTDAAEVIRAREADGTLEIEFAAASDPESTYAATLDSISTAARRNQDGTNVVDAEATIQLEGDAAGHIRFNQFAFSNARPGVEATAKITCGRRSALSSWFGDVADFVHRNVLFYVR